MAIGLISGIHCIILGLRVARFLSSIHALVCLVDKASQVSLHQHHHLTAQHFTPHGRLSRSQGSETATVLHCDPTGVQYVSVDRLGPIKYIFTLLLSEVAVGFGESQ
ncbi:unnamed protein product [Leuciscus chuanchicus]